MSKKRKPKPPRLSPVVVERRLRELYDQIPRVDCTGACHGACCFIQASDHERRRMERAGGKQLRTIDAARDPAGAQGGHAAANARPFGQSRVGRDGQLQGRYRCSFLSAQGDCEIYEDRPLICRLWGAAEGLECDKCRPNVELLPLGEAMAMILKSTELGGGGDDPMTAADVKTLLEQPATRDILAGWLADRRRGNNWKLNALD